MRTLVAATLVFLLAGCAANELTRQGRRIDLADGAPVGRIARSAPIHLERATDPDKAFRWRRLAWLDENGEIPPDALQRARAQREQNLAFWEEAGNGESRGLDATDWVARGPTNVGGRTRSILIHPANHNRLWAGAVGGGIWHSEDAGATWTQVNDWLPNLAICCLAFDPSNPNTMYAGTGEGFFNGDAIGGTGIYKSTDGGTAWNLLSSTSSWDNVCRIAVSPTNSNVILAARRYYGIFRSTNGGATWTNPRWAQGSYYVAFDPSNASNAIAQIIDYDWDTSQWFHSALYSTDGGVTWSNAAGLTQIWDFGSRIELAYAPSNPSIVYASCAANGGKIWRSTDGGHSYTLRTTSGSSGCSWYANPLWVDPTNPDILLVGGVHIFRSTDGGQSLTQISNGYILTDQAHPDIHFFAQDAGFNGTTNRRLYVGTDGGVHRTENVYTASTTSGWTSLQSSYVATQFYGAAGDGPTGKLYGGTQDNGTLRVLSGSTQANLPFGGDGGFCAIDPTNTNYCYGEYVTLQIHRSTNGGQSASYITSGLSDAGTNANFIAPFILDPNNPNTMLAGGASLWRSTNVKAGTPTWQAIRAPGSDVISAIAVAKSNSNLIWVAQNNGEVYYTTNGTAGSPTWITVDNNSSPNPLPDRYVTRIVIDPDDSQTVYVALGGFSTDNLWKTTNSGGTWSDITGSGTTGLPSAPIRGLARHPQRRNWLYVGTEVGIFASLNGGGVWTTTNRGPADVSVDELTFMHNSTTLLAATHGRGLFTADAPVVRGDMNCDDVVNNQDIDGFVLALFGEGNGFAAYYARYPACDPTLADMNADGHVNNQDIDGFIAKLFGA